MGELKRVTGRFSWFPAESAVPLLTSEESMSLLNGLTEHRGPRMSFRRWGKNGRKFGPSAVSKEQNIEQ